MNEEFNTMIDVAYKVKDAISSDKFELLFIKRHGSTNFPYTKATLKGYTNENSDILRYSVYVEIDNDIKGDGKLDSVKTILLVVIDNVSLETTLVK